MFGESAIAHGGRKLQRPNQGVPQGNGMGPPGWSLVSAPCLDPLRKHGFGAKMQLPISPKTMKFVGCACVDDTDQVETAKFDGEDITSIVSQMQ